MISNTSELSITPLTPSIGAVVEGMQIAEPLSDARLRAMKNALAAHHVLFFREQRLTPAEQRNFAAQFGP